MLKIKLSPVGKKNEHTYRIVVCEGRSKITGKNIQILGQYNPLTGSVNLNKTDALGWISKGAQPTERVARLISEAK